MNEKKTRIHRRNSLDGFRATRVRVNETHVTRHAAAAMVAPTASFRGRFEFKLIRPRERVLNGGCGGRNFA